MVYIFQYADFHLKYLTKLRQRDITLSMTSLEINLVGSLRSVKIKVLKCIIDYLLMVKCFE